MAGIGGGAAPPIQINSQADMDAAFGAGWGNYESLQRQLGSGSCVYVPTYQVELDCTVELAAEAHQLPGVDTWSEREWLVADYHLHAAPLAVAFGIIGAAMAKGAVGGEEAGSGIAPGQLLGRPQRWSGGRR